MINKETAVLLQNISKVYRLYDKPIDRLKESIHPYRKKYHKDFHALTDVNLDIKKGEVLGIVGVNGAGKSTLLKIIAGVLTPTTGRISVDGRVNAILELGSGLNPEMTGREAISLNLQINGFEQDREDIAGEVIQFADIGDYIDQPVKTYSSGMKARLGFGIATSTSPEILIVDEVLAVGDALFQRKCYGRIEKLFKDGKTVIFVSHSTQSVVEFCSRAVLLYDKKIIMDDAPKEVTDFYQRLIFSKNKRAILDQIAVAKPGDAETVVNDIDSTHYLEELKSTPNIVKNADVIVSDITIKNVDGYKVNVLEIGKQYFISYKVKFNIDCQSVKFGHLIKTPKGLIISGETLPDRKKPIPKVKQGSVYDIRSAFVCNFFPGAYFLDVGTTSDIKGEKFYLNMHYDAVPFKVQGRGYNFWGHLNIWKEQNIINELS